MNILALDTSMGACSAALLRSETAGKRLIARRAIMERGHAEALLPMVDEIMQESGATFADLDRIAATVGPGSFTGVRIAIAAARGFALVTHASLWGTDSLTVMAAEAGAADAGHGAPFAVAVDARREKLYVGTYAADGARIEGPLLLAPDEAAARLPGDLKVALGSGASSLALAAAALGLSLKPGLPDLQPSAAALAELALLASDCTDTLRPLYLRPADAKPQAPQLAKC